MMRVSALLLTLAAVAATPATATPVILEFFHFGPSAGSETTFYPGDTITVGVNFSKALVVEGTPLLALTIGANTRNAAYTGLDGDLKTAFFDYTVAGSDSDSDGYGIPERAISLNGGSISARDDGLGADLYNAAETANWLVSSSARPTPTVQMVTVTNAPRFRPPNWTFRKYEFINVGVWFTTNVSFTGHPRVALDIGGVTRYAEFHQFSPFSRAELQFRYMVQASDADTDGISIPANAISGGTIAGLGGTLANLNHAAVTSPLSHLLVDGSHTVELQAGQPYLLPEEAPPPEQGSLNSCDVVRPIVSFPFPVTVSGSPKVTLHLITLQTGWAYPREATFVDYLSWDDESTLVFEYEVQDDDFALDGISFPENAISLNGGKIVLKADPTIEATVTHAARPAYADFTVNGGEAVAPAEVDAIYIGSLPADGQTYRLGEEIRLWAQFNRAVTVTGAPTLALTVGSAARKARFRYVHNSLNKRALFTYEVQASDLDADGISMPANAISLNGGAIEDNCRSSSVALASNAVAGGPNQKVDGGGPYGPTGPGGGGGPSPDPEPDPPTPPPPPPPPTVSVSGAQASESAGAVVFDVRLSRTSGSEVTVDYATSDGAGASGAKAGTDYTATAGTLTFNSGSQAEQIRVPVTDDRRYEASSETFTLTLQRPVNATLAGGGPTLRATGTIHDDDDGPPTAAFEFTGATCDEELCRAQTGVPVEFVDTSTGKVLSRRWDFGDGTAASSVRSAHSWSEPGFYEVTLEVDDGETSSKASRKFLVEAAAPAGTCAADDETRCLGDSRFAVEVDWRTGDGRTGPGYVVHEGTNDSALFHFFEPGDNWEVLIKVLDGCSVNERVWVYGASATTLGYTIQVTDTVTGTVREYRNEPGMPADAITDSEAFAGVCGDGSFAASASAGVEAPGASPAADSVLLASEAGACVESGTVLCLHDGRYEVTLEFTTSEETAPATVARPRTGDSGLFYFFAPNNWEMLLKVLDGCGVNEHHWVFAASATDVGLSLTVRDTTSGARKTYTKVPGEPAPAIADVGAFPDVCQPGG